MNRRKIIYFDLDGVLVDLTAGIKKLARENPHNYDYFTFNPVGQIVDEVENLFVDLPPNKEMVKLFKELSEDDRYDVYIASTAPWDNPSSWTDKRLWVETYLGKGAYKRLILTHHKNLLRGDVLIDDRTANGAGEFEGTHILYTPDVSTNEIKKIIENLI